MDKKKLAEYIKCLSEVKETTHRAEDRHTLDLYLADSAKILAKAELAIPLDEDITSHERLWGYTWLIDNASAKTIGKKWDDFKNTLI